MRLSAKLIASFAVAAVLVAAIVTSFVLVGANAASTSRQNAAPATAGTESTTNGNPTATAGTASETATSAGDGRSPSYTEIRPSPSTEPLSLRSIPIAAEDSRRSLFAERRCYPRPAARLR